MSQTKLMLQPQHWYGWQMVPGYVGARNVPYFSPILVHEIAPRKTGRSILELRFLNALYAEGVQNFALDLRILKHAADYLVAEILYDGSNSPERVGIISHIEFEWLRRFCPGLWAARPPEAVGALEQNSVSLYLQSLFLRR